MGRSFLLPRDLARIIYSRGGQGVCLVRQLQSAEGRGTRGTVLRVEDPVLTRFEEGSGLDLSPGLIIFW
jgi:hypothetical protein